MTTVPDSSRTKHASEAQQISDLFATKFGTMRFGTEVQRYVLVKEPDGPSTDGGRKARQPIVLTSYEEETAGSGIMCGWVDSPRREAELRGFAVVKQSFESRHKRELDISRGEYNRMLDAVQEFLKVQAFQTRVTNAKRPSPRPAPSAAAQPAPANANTTPMLVIAFVLGFAVCYLLVAANIIK